MIGRFATTCPFLISGNSLSDSGEFCFRFQVFLLYATQEEIEKLRSEKEALLLEDANRVGMQQRLDELEAFLDEHQGPVTDYDEGLVRKLVERITVYDDYLAFEFKCGAEITIIL